MLVEDCSEDHPFSLHLPLRKITPELDALPTQEKEHVRALVEGLHASGEQVGETIYHLVQQEDVILKIHSEELPPDEYYDELGPSLSRKSWRLTKLSVPIWFTSWLKKLWVSGRWPP